MKIRSFFIWFQTLYRAAKCWQVRKLIILSWLKKLVRLRYWMVAWLKGAIGGKGHDYRRLRKGERERERKCLREGVKKISLSRLADCRCGVTRYRSPADCLLTACVSGSPSFSSFSLSFGVLPMCIMRRFVSLTVCTRITIIFHWIEILSNQI